MEEIFKDALSLETMRDLAIGMIVGAYILARLIKSGYFVFGDKVKMHEELATLRTQIISCDADIKRLTEAHDLCEKRCAALEERISAMMPAE